MTIDEERGEDCSSPEAERRCPTEEGTGVATVGVSKKPVRLVLGRGRGQGPCQLKAIIATGTPDSVTRQSGWSATGSVPEAAGPSFLPAHPCLAATL